MPLKRGNRLDFLTASDAYDIRKRCSIEHLKTLYGLVEDVERRIHVAASTGEYDAIYTVPLYSTELPIYNQEEMRKELVDHFRRHGFLVMPINQTGMPRTSIYLNWKRAK